MSCWYIFYIDHVGFSDTINIKAVKRVFRYFGNVKGSPDIKEKKCFKFRLKNKFYNIYFKA